MLGLTEVFLSILCIRLRHPSSQSLTRSTQILTRLFPLLFNKCLQFPVLYIKHTKKTGTRFSWKLNVLLYEKVLPGEGFHPMYPTTTSFITEVLEEDIQILICLLLLLLNKTFSESHFLEMRRK